VGSVPADIVMVVGVPTVGVTVTVRVVAAEGPLQPLAVTEMVAEPEYPFVHVITPEVAFMVPAPAGLTDQLKPVLFAAVVAYVVVVVPLVS
jgi:hypothetical protein